MHSTKPVLQYLKHDLNGRRDYRVSIYLRILNNKLAVYTTLKFLQQQHHGVALNYN